MPKSFEELLKAGKGKVSEGNKNEDQREWRRRIRNVMDALHHLNDFYEEPNKTNLVVEATKCSSCGKASFVVVAKNIKKRDQSIRFIRAKWKRIEKKYVCDTCQGS